MESILSQEMRIKLASDPRTRSAIGRLYQHYDSFPAQIADNFETPQRNVNRPRVSFRSERQDSRIGESSSSRIPIQSTQSTPRNTSMSQDPRLSVASTGNIHMDQGAPRPHSRRSLAVMSPMPFEESARTLNSLLEPAEGEYHLHAPPVSGTIELESPRIRQRERLHERESFQIERSVT